MLKSFAQEVCLAVDRCLTNGLGRRDLRVGPVFLIGPPRAGTTLLYQVLVKAFRFNYVTNIHAHFLRTPVLGKVLESIAMLFLGKAVIIGLLGAVVGFLVGTALALNFGPDIFKITAKAIKPEFVLLGWALIAAPVFAAVCSFIPVTIAVTHDPADTLRVE